MTYFRNLLRSQKVAAQVHRFHKQKQHATRTKLTPTKWKLYQLMFHTRTIPIIATKQTRTLTKQVTRYITVYNTAFRVEVPKNYSVDHALERYYPNLYQIMVQEADENDDYYGPSYEDYDELWDRLDYQEWMCD